ncbi:MAG: TetR/AcrR family transcriptional regulator [Candidatus Hodarchaeales archaeon]|jgi:AcrR family transcriptional regulator
MSSKKTREESKKATIQKIVQTTKTMILRDGYNAITTTKIANEAKISVGIIYSYFPEGKPAIAKEIFKEGIIKLIDDEIISDLNEDTFPTFIKQIITKFVSQHRENESILIAMSIAILTNDEIFKDFLFLNQTEFDKVTKLILVMKELGLYSDPVSAKTGILLLKILDTLIHHHIVFEEIFESDSELIEFLSEFALKAPTFKTLQ